MRNVEVVIALLFGYMVAYVCKQSGNRFVDTSNIYSAPGITYARIFNELAIYGAPCLQPWSTSSNLAALVNKQ